MPPAVAAAPVFASLSAFLSTTIIGSITVGSVLATAALSGVSYALNKAAAKKANRGITSELEKQIVKQALPVGRVIYGRALVGGALNLIERKGDWLYYSIILASHEIDAIEEIRMGDRVIGFDNSGAANTIPYLSGTTVYLYRSVRLGGDDQTIDPILDVDFPELPASFRCRGMASVVLKMYQPVSISADLNRTLYGNSGQPTPLFLVRGKKVYDPRDPSQSQLDKTTWKWNDSPSLCAADLETTARNMGGNGSKWDDIDLEKLAIAANHDNQPVPLKNGDTERRYTCNGVISLDGTAASENISKILTANAGTRVTSNGKYVFLSGVPRQAVWTLNDHSSRGSMTAVLEPSVSEMANIIRTTFVSRDREYQLSEGPEIRNAAYITADGTEMPLNPELPFTDSQTTAQRLGNIMLEQSRLGKRISRREDLPAILFDAADVVNVESSVLTAASGKYILETVSTTDSPIEFEVTMREYSDLIYNWLPNVQEQDFIIAPPTLT